LRENLPRLKPRKTAQPVESNPILYEVMWGKGLTRGRLMSDKGIVRAAKRGRFWLRTTTALLLGGALALTGSFPVNAHKQQMVATPNGEVLRLGNSSNTSIT
jgi:hypothetical protein